ncbi:hypothetical protein P9112_011371 [Eukaryota sp. TZLM1-RC]
MVKTRIIFNQSGSHQGAIKDQENKLRREHGILTKPIMDFNIGSVDSRWQAHFSDTAQKTTVVQDVAKKDIPMIDENRESLFIIVTQRSQTLPSGIKLGYIDKEKQTILRVVEITQKEGVKGDESNDEPLCRTNFCNPTPNLTSTETTSQGFHRRKLAMSVEAVTRKFLLDLIANSSDVVMDWSDDELLQIVENESERLLGDVDSAENEKANPD